VELVFLQMQQECTSSPVHDAFGHARRTGRKDDVERLVERELFETGSRIQLRTVRTKSSSVEAPLISLRSGFVPI